MYTYDVSTNFLDVTQHHVMREWAVKIISDWATHIRFVDPHHSSCCCWNVSGCGNEMRLDTPESRVGVVSCNGLFVRSRQSFVGWTLETSVGSASKNIAVYIRSGSTGNEG